MFFFLFLSEICVLIFFCLIKEEKGDFFVGNVAEKNINGD